MVTSRLQDSCELLRRLCLFLLRAAVSNAFFLWFFIISIIILKSLLCLLAGVIPITQFKPFQSPNALRAWTAPSLCWSVWSKVAAREEEETNL